MPKTRIKADFSKLVANFSDNTHLSKDVATLLAALKSEAEKAGSKGVPTPCCMQISEAFNLAGYPMPARSFRRAAAPVRGGYYLLAVDEVHHYLSGRYGRGESLDASVGVTNFSQAQKYLGSRQGILTMLRGDFWHVEFWKDGNFLQSAENGHASAAMSPSLIARNPVRVFWDIGTAPDDVTVPSWLQGWWKVWDGNDYYYYFSEDAVVTYTKIPPNHINIAPVGEAANEGTVTVSADSSKMTIVWDEAGGAQTIESFTHNIASRMDGTSNRYSPLVATKLG